MTEFLKMDTFAKYFIELSVILDRFESDDYLGSGVHRLLIRDS